MNVPRPAFRYVMAAALAASVALFAASTRSRQFVWLESEHGAALTLGGDANTRQEGAAVVVSFMDADASVELTLNGSLSSSGSVPAAVLVRSASGNRRGTGTLRFNAVSGWIDGRLELRIDGHPTSGRLRVKPPRDASVSKGLARAG